MIEPFDAILEWDAKNQHKALAVDEVKKRYLIPNRTGRVMISKRCIYGKTVPQPDRVTNRLQTPSDSSYQTQPQPYAL